MVDKPNNGTIEDFILNLPTSGELIEEIVSNFKFNLTQVENSENSFYADSFFPGDPSRSIEMIAKLFGWITRESIYADGATLIVENENKIILILQIDERHYGLTLDNNILTLEEGNES